MNPAVKQRLLGALVLICIGLIIWPLVFTHVPGPVVDERSIIPPVPAFDKYTVPAPRPPEGIEPVTTTPEPIPVPTPVPDADSPSVRAPVQLTEQGLPQSWVLQVASFSDKDNAARLVRELQAEGYKAFTLTVPGDGGSNTRVMIGPKLNQQSLLAIKPAIDRQYQVDALLMRYVP